MNALHSLLLIFAIFLVQPTLANEDYNGDGRVNMWDKEDRAYDDRWNPDRYTDEDYNGDGKANMWDREERRKDKIWNTNTRDKRGSCRTCRGLSR